MEYYWFSPKNLEKLRAEYENSDPVSLLEGGDFFSYAKANRGAGLVGSSIENHNLVNPEFRVRSYKHIVGSSSRAKIADLGFGLSFSSKALADIFSADVDGYEISHDAVQFSKKLGLIYVFLSSYRARCALGENV